MNPFVVEVREVLAQTPATVRGMLGELSDPWILDNTEPSGWSPFDIVGHYIHGEETDWIPRLRVILEHGETKPFESFDRFAQFEKSKGKTLAQLLDRFAQLRAENLATLDALNLSAAQLELRGRHPELGTVTLKQLLATWAAHDLNHVGQISRVMAKRYIETVGPWKQYLGVLNR